MKVSAVLVSGFEFAKIGSWLQGTAPLFVDNAVDREVYYFILQRTLRYGKFKECISPAEFEKGHPELGLIGLGYERSRIWRARKKLSSAGLVIWKSSSDATVRTQYLVNLPGIADVFESIWPMEGMSERATAEWHRMVDILQRARMHGDFTGIDIFPRARIRREIMANLTQDTVKVGLRMSEEARERRRKKRDRKPMEAKWIVDFCKETCEELDVPYYEEWTGRERGCAKNFLTYCEEAGNDPRRLLGEAINHWTAMEQGVLFREDGSPIHLHPSFSFMQFFTYRREIGSWLASGGPETTTKWEIEEGEPISMSDVLSGKYKG